MKQLVQAYRDNWVLFYQQSLSGSPSIPIWDVCVLTAANPHQARAYELQIELRKRQGLLPPSTQWLVVSDPEGRRIGSGGATLNVLQHLVRLLGSQEGFLVSEAGRQSDLFKGKRILIVHSGGDSKRLPHYSAFGKLFARLPHELPDGRASTLFDEFIVSLSGLPRHMYEGVVIASGDVLLVFDHLQLDFNRQGVVGVGMSVPVAVGTRHGVFVSEPPTGKVRQFLHKPSLEKLEAVGAVDVEQRVTVDTGIVWLDPDTAGRLVEKGAGGVLEGLIREGICLNLYGDFLGLLPPEASREEYLRDESDGPVSQPLLAVRKQLWEEFRGVPFSVQTLRPARFIHFGATAEYRDAVFAEQVHFSEAGWSSSVQSYSHDHLSRANPDLVLISSIVNGVEVKEGGRVVFDDSLLTGPARLGKGVILTGVRHTDQRKPLVVLDDLVLHQLPVRTNDGPAWVSRIYGVSDNPKKVYTEPGATFLNCPWKEWLEKADVSEADLWDGIPAEARTLWNARLYPVAGSPDESLRLTEWIQWPEQASQDERFAWKQARRLSLEESYLQADLDRILDLTSRLQEDILVERFLAAIRDPTTTQAPSGFPGQDLYEIQRRIGRLEKRLESEADALYRMRALKVASDLLMTSSTRSIRVLGETLEERAFSELAHVIRENTRMPVVARRREGGRSVLVESPARIDLGGGWSDTAPFSIEQGGTVLNAAITLNGSFPVRVEASWLDEPGFVLESADLGVRKQLDTEDLHNYRDLSDPLALHKAALVSVGLESFNGRGIRLRTEIAIPKGSGLGTSSIMAAAVLSALNHLTGREVDEHLLFDQVFALEQQLTTGGGWQDQVGGVVGGLKLIHTKPGLPQSPQWDHILVPEILHDRLHLIYTGQRRLAKRILRAIMGGYVSREPRVVEVLFEIQDLARQMAGAIAAGNVDELGRLLGRHWKANVRLDPGSTNPVIDELFERLDPLIVGGKLAGAGGGGFAIVVSRAGIPEADLAQFLGETYPDSEVRLWPCRIVDQGLRVTLNPDEIRSSRDAMRSTPR